MGTDLDKLGIRVLSQDLLASRIAPDSGLEIDRLDIDQLFRCGHSLTPDCPVPAGLSTIVGGPHQYGVWGSLEEAGGGHSSHKSVRSAT